MTRYHPELRALADGDTVDTSPPPTAPLVLERERGSSVTQAIDAAAGHLLALLQGDRPSTEADQLASWREVPAFTRLEVTLTELGRSRRRGTRTEISAFGETKTAAAWAEDPRFQVTAQALVQRIASGMRVTDALTLPVTKMRKPEERASLQMQFLDLLLTGDKEVPEARDQLGIPRSTLAAWMRNNPAFDAAVIQATAQGIVRAQLARLAHIQMGSTLTGAAQRTGIHPHRISAWRRDDPAFAQRLQSALARKRGRRRPG